MAEAPATALGRPAGLSIEGILQMLPHRYPMLMVDRIDHLDPGQEAEGVKCVTINEPFFPGHFAERPVMPGVLLVESMAQIAGIMLQARYVHHHIAPAGDPLPAPRIGVLAAIQKMRFRRPVLPGDRLRIRVKHLKSFNTVHQVKAEAFVEGQLVAEGELLLS